VTNPDRADSARAKFDIHQCVRLWLESYRFRAERTAVDVVSIERLHIRQRREGGEDRHVFVRFFEFEKGIRAQVVGFTEREGRLRV